MSKLYRVYLFFNSKFKKNFWILIGLTLLSVILETVGVGIIVPLVALFNPQNNSKYIHYLKLFFGNVTNSQMIIYSLLLLFLFFVFKNLFLTFYSWYQNSFINNFLNFITNKLYQNYLFQPYNFHLNNNSSVLIKNVSGETEALRDIVVQFITLVSEILIIFSILLLLFIFEPIGTLTIVIFIILIGVVYFKLTKKFINIWGNERSLYRAHLTKDLMEGLAGIKDILILGRMEYFLNNFNINYRKYSNANKKYSILSTIPKLLIELFLVLSLIIITTVVIYKRNNFQLIIPLLSLYVFSAFRLMPSFNKVFNSIQHIRFCLPSIDIISSSLNLKIFQTEQKNYLNKIDFKNFVQIKDLNFAYDDSIKILNNINFTFYKNNSIGIIGESGSGKSTLIDIILGLLTPNSGQIIVDNTDINESKETLQIWQKNIGYVPQSIFLIDDTIKKNIALGVCDDQIDEKNILKVIKEAQLEEFINELPQGINTFVGERGARLSGGQRQRIGIARALYYNPNVLVFDEATSALDINTEESIISLIKQMKNRTIIIITHRLSTIDHCDFIYKIKDGNIELCN